MVPAATLRQTRPAGTYRTWSRTVLAVLAAILAPHAQAQTHDCRVADRPQQQLAILELYTSEGCSSCPPASRWLRQFDARTDLAIVEFHVDYWDDLGWRDPFGDARFSARQRERARRRGSRTVYTPDVSYNGSSRNDWARGWLPPRSTVPAPFVLEVTAELSEGRRLAVHWSSHGAPINSTTWVAVTQSDLASAPTRGENGGVVLRHSHVARVFETDLATAGGSIDIALPADLAISASRVQLVVEDALDARPLHAVVLPLAACLGATPPGASAMR